MAPETQGLEWNMTIREVQHVQGKYPVFEWAYGNGRLVAFVIQAWPQGFLLFKESRDSDDEAFKTGGVDELLAWMQKVKNWQEEPPRIREIWETILETQVSLGRIENSKTEDFFRLLWEKLRVFCPAT